MKKKGNLYIKIVIIIKAILKINGGIYMVEPVVLGKYTATLNRMDKHKDSDEYCILINRYIELIEEREELQFKIVPYLKFKYLISFGLLMKEELYTIISIKKLNKINHLASSGFKNKMEFELGKKKDVVLNREIEFLRVQIENIDNMSKGSKIYINNLTNEDIDELKAIFKLLARRLSPEINNNISARKNRLWNRAKEAYNKNDLASLKVLSNLLNNGADYNVRINIDDLQSKINQLYNDIENIKKEFPFNMKENLADDNWILESRCDMINRIEELKKEEERLKSM